MAFAEDTDGWGRTGGGKSEEWAEGAEATRTARREGGGGGSSLHVMHLNMYRDNARREDLRGSQGSRMEWSVPECFRQFVYRPSVSRPFSISLSLSRPLSLLSDARTVPDD